MMQQVLKILGFWPPLVYAFAVFSLFWLLDRNAAPRARKAISGWFAGPHYNQQDVAAAVLYVFDKFYTAPLFGWRAVFRSAGVSTVVTVIVAYQVFPMSFALIRHSPEAIGFSAVWQLLQNILADYLSLFLVRRWLILGGLRPLLALTTAPVLGIAIVAICYDLTDVARFSISTRTFEWHYFLDDIHEWRQYIRNGTFRWAFLVPALLVHLWLPLFALGVAFAKAINSLRAAGVLAQWFFKQGEFHPLRSIGYVAGAATFLITALGMLIRGT
ncbi:hypothetical protein HZZ13_27160 [Bradyrhizobium sp. CNPSo 4010]|uniref:Uncharacterized protein n=1 Tax=Bradyrhizobium agreste TaxID=2751811 RepID=A0ABS0PW63_9BRAD|nr:hypothetical protein [Bradyrhizobium agreste]MBH5401438.1 hypothetical protein [Bradyrhizobium agreste]